MVLGWVGVPLPQKSLTDTRNGNGGQNRSGMGERHKMELEKVASPIREELGFHSLCTWHPLKCCEQERDVITCVKIFSLCCGGQRGGGNR